MIVANHSEFFPAISGSASSANCPIVPLRHVARTVGDMTVRATPSAAFLTDPSVSDPVLGFAESSFRATNVVELDQTMADYMRRFEIETFVLCRATDQFKRPSAARIAGSSNMRWRAHYDERNLAKSDDLLSAGLTSSAPTTWMTFRQEQQQRGRPGEIYDEAREFGLRDGFYLPIHQSDGSVLGVSMMARQEMPTSRTTLAALHMLAVYYHLAAERLGLVEKLAPLKPPAPAKAILTKRQLECLKWIRQGKTSWEISQILGISEHTVHEHLEQARTRLRVRTTTQAVLEAVVLGLIQL